MKDLGEFAGSVHMANVAAAMLDKLSVPVSAQSPGTLVQTAFLRSSWNMADVICVMHTRCFSPFETHSISPSWLQSSLL